VAHGEDSKIAKYWEDPISQRVLGVLLRSSREHKSFATMDVVDAYNDIFRDSFSTMKTEMNKMLRSFSRDGLIETMKGDGQWLVPNRTVLKNYINSDDTVKWSESSSGGNTNEKDKAHSSSKKRKAHSSSKRA
jgi:hypothetical protein